MKESPVVRFSGGGGSATATPSAGVDVGRTSARPVHVYGYLGSAAPLGAAAREHIASADLVVGGRRHLDALDVPPERRLVLGPIDPAVERLRAAGPDEDVVVLASGDPGFFGIVRRLHLAGVPLVVRPGPSACALAFGRLGLPWEGAQIVSAHGRELRRAVNVVRAYPLVAVMTDVGSGIREIAAALGPWPRRLALCERLGELDERVRWFSLEEAVALDPGDVREPNVVVAVAPTDLTGVDMPWRLGAGGRAVNGRMARRADVLSALVMGAFGPRVGDLVAVLGEDAEATSSAAAERGAAVSRLSPSGGVRGPGGMPLLDDPDLVCVAETGERLSVALDAVEKTWQTLRCLAVVTDSAGIRLAEAFVSRIASDEELTVRRVAVPEPVDSHRVPAVGPDGPERHLLVVDRVQAT